MLDQLLSGFMNSDQGKGALGVLAQRGVSGAQASSIFEAALPAATTMLSKQAGGGAKGAPSPLGLFDILGGHPGQAFLIGAVTSLVQGEGFTEAAKDGAVGVLGSHLGEVLASRVGVDRQMAGWAGAAIAPFIVSYAYDKLAGDDEVQKQRPLSKEEQIAVLKKNAMLAQKQAAVMADPNSAAGQKLNAQKAAGTMKQAVTAAGTAKLAAAQGTVTPQGAAKLAAQGKPIKK
jgi:hypothetical protein